MRDKQKNIYDFYSQLAEVHAKSFPDMRPGQFLLNALGDIHVNQKRDPFFPEADELLDRIKYYCNHASVFYNGWSVLNNYGKPVDKSQKQE